MKFAEPRPYADPAKAAQKLIEIAYTQRVDKGRICVGEWNDKFRAAKGSVGEYAAGRDRLIADGVIAMHDSGTMFWFTPEGASRYPRPG